jgi:hypothetical protein
MTIKVLNFSPAFYAGEDITIDENGHIEFDWKCGHENVGYETVDDYLTPFFSSSRDIIYCEDCNAQQDFHMFHEEGWR